eukprot:GGOE01048468.1.p2 GENE.GGOE01048468.1~~GGOE01048468.1.p2  ORF type:complete len:154 (+),score=48.66 GGOE01048468.1:59-520(+)
MGKRMVRSRSATRQPRRKPYDREDGTTRSSRSGGGSGEQPAQPVTRGRIVMRHKQEWRQLRDRLQEMDKEKKLITSATPELKRLKKLKTKEMRKLKEEMMRRHQEELEAFDSAQSKSAKDELAKIVAPPMSRLQALELQHMFKGLLRGPGSHS